MLRSLLLSASLAAAAGAALAEPFSFVLLGDAPYGKPEEVYPPFRTLIETVNSRDPALVIHIGDTKSGSTECSDRMLDEQLAFLRSFEAPLLYSLGDNEWTDCHRHAAGGYDPEERLAYIRQHYFADPSASFGKAGAAVESQAARGYPENARLEKDGILFVTAHVVGSNNNFEPRDMAAVEEFMARDAATADWLVESFDKGRDAKAIVVAIQADMFESDFGPAWDPEGFLGQSGFAHFGETLKTLSNRFARPVLLVYGDSHVFRMFRPFPKTAPFVMALETFGSANMHAVEVSVDPDDAFPFSVHPLLNPARPFAAPE
ncbi:hypothetical protein [Poseidonocella sp. HB161398]|uniref:hypothetical protein n=1 Tax=Poseidonocella sp. HB161398 TaxID=2320855 RepID=UPI00110944E8|nr:hypothetical protein [Poseidonocella sp. HB161398]